MRAFQLVGWQKVELAASTAALRMAGIGAKASSGGPPARGRCSTLNGHSLSRS
jgi:hypothetical protein